MMPVASASGSRSSKQTNSDTTDSVPRARRNAPLSRRAFPLRRNSESRSFQSRCGIFSSADFMDGVQAFVNKFEVAHDLEILLPPPPRELLLPRAMTVHRHSVARRVER